MASRFRQDKQPSLIVTWFTVVPHMRDSGIGRNEIEFTIQQIAKEK
ncbi:MAG TPA: hypothetical protein VGZ71_12070 [Puia sp.]|jgi:hypothetical protein|nr:hypothetical protein [Puia sp.]